MTSPDRLTPESVREWSFKRDTAMVGIDRSSVAGFQMAVLREITTLYAEQRQLLDEVRRLTRLSHDWSRAYNELKYALWDLQAEADAANRRPDTRQAR